MIYEDMITSVIPQIKHEARWVHLYFSSLKSNTRWDKLITDIGDNPIPSHWGSTKRTCDSYDNGFLVASRRPLVLAVLRHWLPASRQMPLGGEVHSRCASPAMACVPKFLCSLDAPVSCCWLSPLLSSMSLWLIFLCRHRSLENWSNVDIR
jgi:hypothetical protein